MFKLTGVSVSGLVDPIVAYAYTELAPSAQTSLTAPLSNRISIRNLTVCAHTNCLRDYRVSMENGQASIRARNVDFGTRYVDNKSPILNEVYWTPGNKSKTSFTFGTLSDYQQLSMSSGGFFPKERTPTIFRFEDNQWSNDEATSALPTNPLIDRIQDIRFGSVMSDVAASFTKMGLEKSTDTVNGTVQTSKDFVSVQWSWSILPAFLVVLGAIFFICTTATNKSQDASIEVVSIGTFLSWTRGV